MKISINRDSEVAIRDQLVDQIGLQIASGSLKADEKLPSVRALASRLGIHYNTVSSAYNHLADVGLLEVRQGSGVRVAGKLRRRDFDLKSATLEDMIKSFLPIVAEHGFSRRELKAAMEQALEQKPVKRILVVDRNPDFHPLLIAELQPHLSLPVEPITVQDLSKRSELLADSLVVTSLYHLIALRELDILPTRLVVCNVEPGRTEIEAVVNLPESSLVLLVSVSPTLIKLATNVMAAVRGNEVAVRGVALEERKELEYSIPYAKLVVCDGPSKDFVSSVGGRTPVQVFRLYSSATIDLIKERLQKWG